MQFFPQTSPLSMALLCSAVLVALACTRPLPPHMGGPASQAKEAAGDASAVASQPQGTLLRISQPFTAVPSRRDGHGVRDHSAFSTWRLASRDRSGPPGDAAYEDVFVSADGSLSEAAGTIPSEDTIEVLPDSIAEAQPQGPVGTRGNRKQAEPSGSRDAVPSDRNAFSVPVSPVSMSLAGWRVLIPAIGVDAPIEPVGVEPNGAMGEPEGPDVVGWYAYGPAHGEQGNILLDGHVDWTDRRIGIPRGAVCWDLAKLPIGSEIIITNDAGEYVYKVSDKVRFKWDDPTGASVLQPTSEARATLVTCGGVFHRATRNYSMRDVIIARLVG